MPATMVTQTPVSSEEFLAYLGAADSTRDLASALSDVVMLRRRRAVGRKLVQPGVAAPTPSIPAHAVTRLAQ